MLYGSSRSRKQRAENSSDRVFDLRFSEVTPSEDALVTFLLLADLVLEVLVRNRGPDLRSPRAIGT